MIGIGPARPSTEPKPKQRRFNDYVFMIMAPIMLIVMLAAVATDLHYLMYGVETTATSTYTYTSSRQGFQYRRPTVYYANYTYEVEGQAYTNRASIGYEDYVRVNDGEALRIRYLRSNPAESLPLSNTDWLLTTLGLALGAWGTIWLLLTVWKTIRSPHLVNDLVAPVHRPPHPLD